MIQKINTVALNGIFKTINKQNRNIIQTINNSIMYFSRIQVQQ